MISKVSESTSLVERIKSRQAEIGLSDQQLGAGLGYNKVVVVSLLLMGNMKLPLAKIPSLAAVLMLDPIDLMRLALADLSPEMLSAIEQTFNPLLLTKAEKSLISHLRKLAGDQEPAPIVFDGRGVIALVLPGTRRLAESEAS